MKYFKTLNDNGNIIRYDECDVNVSNGIEITKEEYENGINAISSDISINILE